MPMPPAAPMPPPVPLGMDDPRFRPVPPGRFRMPPQPAMPYPGRPFVTVEGQYMAPRQPAFVRQYAWRPADQPVSRQDTRPVPDNYRAPEAYPMQPSPMMAGPSPYMPYAPYTPYMPYGSYSPYAGSPYAGLTGYPPGMMPPPPMPYPPLPPMMPGAYPGGPYAGLPDPVWAPFGSPYPMWGMSQYPGIPPMAYPPAPPSPWGSTWPDQAYSGWGSAPAGYPAYPSRFRSQGGLGTGFPIAGLF